MGTWIAGAIVFAALCLAVYYLRKSRKNGGSCTGCSGCKNHCGCSEPDQTDSEA